MCALHLSILALFSALLHKLSYSALVLLSLLAFVSSLLLLVLVLSLDLAPLVLSSNSLPPLCAMGLGTRHAEGTAPPSIIWVRGPKGVFNGWRPEQSSNKASTFEVWSKRVAGEAGEQKCSRRRLLLTELLQKRPL